MIKGKKKKIIAPCCDNKLIVNVIIWIIKGQK